MFDLKKRLARGDTVLMDGAMGSEILNRGVSTDLPLWSARALIEKPDVVRGIHEDYIKAGAEIIITDTFSTTDRILGRGGAEQSGRELTMLAARLARQARDNVKADHPVYIAGSVAPLEDCYSPELTPPDSELEKEHRAMARDLADGGVDFILAETMITARETLAALRAAKASGLPVAVSFCCNERGELLGGEALSEVIPQIEKFEPLFIGVNCVSADIATKTLRDLRKLTGLPLSVYAQGDGGPDDKEGWHLGKGHKVQGYIQVAGEWLNDGAQIIGGCCGTTPEHTAGLRRVVPGNVNG